MKFIEIMRSQEQKSVCNDLSKDYNLSIFPLSVNSVESIRYILVKSKGFTLIELVIVVVLLATLASVALPRFIDITDSAHDANLSGTAGAFGSAVNIAHAKWLASGQPVTEVNNINGISFTRNGKQDIGFSEEGWPHAATNGMRDLIDSDIISKDNINNSKICANIAKNLLSSSSVSFGFGVNCKENYCAEFKGNSCIYAYQKDKSSNRQIIYNILTGQVLKGPI